jgi:hypothetical protein
MAKVKLDLRNKTVPQKVQFIRQVVDKMTGNGTFPSPDPAMAALTAIADKLESDFNAREASDKATQQFTTVLNATEAEADRLLTAEGAHVESVSKGDEAKIRSTGMDVRGDAQPAGDLPAPGNFAVTAGDHDGTLDDTWDRVVGAKSYIIQISPDPITPASFVYCGTSTKSSYTATGLESGKKYWQRVAAVGTAGQSPWSDPAVKIAP